MDTTDTPTADVVLPFRLVVSPGLDYAVVLSRDVAGGAAGLHSPARTAFYLTTGTSSGQALLTLASSFASAWSDLHVADDDVRGAMLIAWASECERCDVLAELSRHFAALPGHVVLKSSAARSGGGRPTFARRVLAGTRQAWAWLFKPAGVGVPPVELRKSPLFRFDPSAPTLPVPIVLVAPGGGPQPVADGQVYATLDDAAQRSGMDRATLLNAWLALARDAGSWRRDGC